MNLYDLTEPMLNVWVAKAEGHLIATTKNGDEVTGYMLYYYSGDTPPIPKYTTDEVVSGSLIALEGITTLHTGWAAPNYQWRASHPNLGGSRSGPTELIAAMRAYVASRFGDELSEEI